MEDFESILPITGVPITMLYCVLPISVVGFHDRVNPTLAYKHLKQILSFYLRIDRQVFNTSTVILEIYAVILSLLD